MDKGVFPEDITVVGHAAGATTALAVSGLVQNRRINYVLLGGCPADPALAIDYDRVMGRFLSIINTADERGRSCRGAMPEHVFYKESSVASPEGSSVFLRTDGDSLRLWLEPVVSFVSAKGARRGR